MYYQWDALLLESTFFVGLLAWFEDGPADMVSSFWKVLGIHETILDCILRFDKFAGPCHIHEQRNEIVEQMPRMVELDSFELPLRVSATANSTRMVFSSFAIIFQGVYHSVLLLRRDIPATSVHDATYRIPSRLLLLPSE